MNKQSPIISIITVTFNAAATIRPTLDSIAEQKGCKPGDDYEVIIMDGASKDDTVAIAESYGMKCCTIISEPDGGIYDAMNKGMNKASGKYYMFLNAGDALHSPATLRTILDAIADNDMPGIVYGQTNLVDNNREYIGPRHLTAPKNLKYESFAEGMLVCHQAFIALSRIAPRYNLKYRFSADYDWCLQCLQHSRKNVFIDDVLIDYLKEGTTTANRYASLRERFRIMCHYFGTVPTIVRHFKFIPRFLSSGQLNSGN